MAGLRRGRWWVRGVLAAPLVWGVLVGGPSLVRAAGERVTPGLPVQAPGYLGPLFGLDAYCASRDHWPEPSCVEHRREREEERRRTGMPGPIFREPPGGTPHH